MKDNQNFPKNKKTSAAAEQGSNHEFIASGTLIAGRYEVLQKIGEGGMAVVYRIQQIFLKETMALKVLTAGLSDTSTVRFQKEAQVCRMLDHPNLIHVYDFAVLENGLPYLVMEFVDGETLSDVLQRKGCLSEDEAINVFIEVLEGLSYAHKSGVTHRDLKPSNIMIGRGADKQKQVKILDFGIAKMTGQDALNHMDLTRTGEIFGSPLYMSPEQCLGKTVDARSDFYSIGCTMYQVLTGAPPFTGESALSTMMLHQQSQPLPLREASLGGTFSTGIEKIILRLLEKSPENRYQAASDVRDDLLALKNKRKFSAQPINKAPKTFKYKVSPAVLVLSIICILLAAALVVVLVIKEDNTQRTTANKSAELKSPLPAADLPSNSTPVSKYFASIPIRDYKSGQWILNFPSTEIGRVGIADSNNNVKKAAFKDRPAKDQVTFPVAKPLFFLTDMQHFDSSSFSRFRPDEIQQLQLEEFRISDSAIEQLTKLTGLAVLELYDCTSLTNQSLESIAKIPNLLALKISNYSADRVHFSEMQSKPLGQMVAKSKLAKFTAENVEQTDLLCKEIQSAATLQHLYLEKDKELTDAGLSWVAEMPRVETLSLVGDKNITDAGIAKLSKLKTLKQLFLQRTSITGKCIPALKRLPKGCEISIDLINWSDPDQNLFRKQFPGNKVP